MAFLNTLDNGQYSPTLCMHAGVDFSVETLPYNSGKIETNPLINERVRGSYDYVSRFAGGFFNFENYYPTVNTPSVDPTELRIYSIDGQFSGIQKQYSGKVTGIYQHNSPSIINYWNSSTNISVYAESGIRRVGNPKNFGNVMPLMMADTNGGVNENINVEGNLYLNVLGSAIIAQGPNYVGADSIFWYYGPKAELTIYGRMKVNYDNSPIAVFGTNFNLFPGNGGSGQPTAMTNGRNYFQVQQDKFKIITKSNAANTIIGGIDNVTKASGFYQFAYCLSQRGTTGQNSYALLYEGDDVTPLRLTASSIVPAGYGIPLASFYSGVTLLAQQSGILWSEFGVDNRLWGLNDVREFNRSRLYPSSFVDESPTLLPVDNDYLNFHFPINSVGTLGATNSGDYTDTGYSITLQPSGLSPYIYEFDRSEFNPQALRVRTVMESVGDNPSGYLKAKVELDGIGAYWQSYPVLVPTTKSEVLMSGQLYDSNDNITDLTDIQASGITGARLNLGAWYEDNGSSWGGDINLYSAKVELDSWLIPQPSAIDNAITLNMKAGVSFCQQTLSVDSGIYNGYNVTYGSRVHGNFDYSNFECGYYNFENTPLEVEPAQTTEFPLYSYDYRFGGTLFMPPNNQYIYNKPFVTDYHRQRGHINVIDGIRGQENFSTCIMASGYYARFKLDTPYSGDLLANGYDSPPPNYPVGEMTMYGRFVIPKSYINTYEIVDFSIPDFSGPESKNTIVIAQDRIRFHFKKNTGYLGNTTYLNGQLLAIGQFYNFMLVIGRDAQNPCVLYEGYDGAPLQITNVNYTSDISFKAWYENPEGINFTASPDGSPIFWTDFGISNRAWTELDIAKFDRAKIFPGFYIAENPYVDLPAPSGDDNTCLTFHYPMDSSGNLNITHRDSTLPINTINYYTSIASGLSAALFEFDRSQFNQTALKIDMWVDNVGSNPSGNINTRINFNRGTYWQSVDIPITNNGPQLLSFSGQFYNYNNPTDMSTLVPNDLFTEFEYGGGFPNVNIGAQLGIGTWYNDIVVPYSGDINVYSARVYMDAYCTIPMTGNAITLYTSGQQVTRDGLDLFLQNSFTSESCDLYINGYSSEASGCDLYISGGFRFDTTTLYIGGMDYQNDNTTLFIEGSTVRCNMPLFIYSQPPSEMSGNIPLSIWATTNPTNANAMSLFIGENAPSGIKTGGMNLYAIGPQSERLTASMNLFLRRDVVGDNSSVTLYCHNEYTDVSGEVTLFMSAPSGTLGAVPVSGQMNLFIARTEGIDGGLDLSISGPAGVEDGIPMFIDGSPADYATIPLSVNGIGVNRETLKIYINGF